jgi:hypothetical protein
MPEPIIFVDAFGIREEKLEDFKQATKEIVELVEANEARMLTYAIYISDDGRQMAGVQMREWLP